MMSLKNSMIIGVASTVLSMVLGTLAALGLAHWKSKFKPLVLAVVLSPVVVPGVITAVGLYFFFAPIGLTGSYLGLILAHTALATPFVVIPVSATLQSFDMNLARAAASLGASPLYAFRRVILPLILPGLASGALFAFATSFDEVVIVLFMAGPEQRTLPREMFSGIRENISPTITAAAVILTTVSVILLATLEGLRRRNERLKGTNACPASYPLRRTARPPVRWLFSWVIPGLALHIEYRFSIKKFRLVAGIGFEPITFRL